MNVPVTPQPTATKSKRAKALKAVTIVMLLSLAYGGYEWYLGRHEEATDNAYVQGNVVQITPQMGGTVTGIFADDNDFVKAEPCPMRYEPNTV